MIKKLLFLIFVLQFVCLTIFAQNPDLKSDAAYYFDIKDYKKAYEAYDKLSVQNPKNIEYTIRLGYSALYYPDKKARSIEIFELLQGKSNTPDNDLYLAKAYHFNYRFDDGIKYYEKFINLIEPKASSDDLKLIEEAKLGIVNCKNGIDMLAKKVTVDIKNLGEPLNTDDHEYVPVISSDEAVIIYTYVGKNSTGGKLNDDLKPDKLDGTFHEDIFISKRINDSTFSKGKSISSSINTNGHDASIALSPDGTTLFTYASTTKDNGDIYVSTYKGEDWSTPEKLNENINTKEWEGSCSITSDGRHLYFASDRPGGLGGRDLYVSEKINNEWGPAVNLGPQINTKYDEDAPFIHPDCITLFFSSQGHKSIGGYDIMYSIKKENNWIEPVSMGIPLNTTEDDRYFVINARGDVGYFSSNRSNSGGIGGQDIYKVMPGIIGEKPVLVLLKGNVYADEKPIGSKIEIRKKSNNELFGPYYSNTKSGKYLMALTPGSGYKMVINVEGYEPIEEEIDIDNLKKFVEIQKDFYVYSENFLPKRVQKSLKQILDSLLENITNAENFNNDVNYANIGNDVKPANTPTSTTVVEKDALAKQSNSSSKQETPKSEPIKSETTKATSPQKNENINPCGNEAFPNFSVLKGKSLNIASNYKKLLDIGGNFCSEGLVFKVQIAAYKFPENYKYDRLIEFGAPEVTKYPDGLTRFTQLQFSTIKEAEAARQKIIKKGQKDAWITGFVGDKRYTLEELVSLDFFGKAIN
ncbi:MAG: hypothetical protein ACK504_06095 [Bacteroidota bacterium]